MKISFHAVSIYENCVMVIYINNIVIKVVDGEEINHKKYHLIAHLYHLGQYVDKQTEFSILLTCVLEFNKDFYNVNAL